MQNINLIKLTFLSLLAVLFLGCNTPEQNAESHLQKGKELLEKGQLDQAILELKTSNQASSRAETSYLMALLDEKRNNFKSMRQNLVAALELDPTMTDARLKLAKADLILGNLPASSENIEKVLTEKPDSIEAKLLKASLLMRQTKIDEAEQIVNSVLNSNPDNIEAVSLKINLLLQRKEIDQALALIDTTLKNDEKNIALRLTRIKINAERKNSEAMTQDYLELARLYPDNENFKLSLASIYAVSDKLADAERLIREVAEKSSGKVEYKILLLEFLNAKLKDRVPGEYEHFLTLKDNTQILELSRWMLVNGYADNAEKGIKLVIAAEKNSNLGLTAQTLLAEIALNKKQYAEVETAVDSILKVNSDFLEASLLKAKLLLAQNKLDEALELLNKAVWTKKDSDAVYLLLGQAYTLKKDTKQADSNFKQALEINPANLGAFYPLYNTYLQANQKEIARQLLDKALKANPNQALLLTSKIELDIDEKKWAEAEETLQRLSLFSKNKAVPLYLQGNVYQGKQQYAEAVQIYEKILEEFPDNLNAMVNLARSFEGLKSRDKAIAYLLAHHDKHPDDLTVVGVLGDIYVANKDLPKAKQLFTDQLKKNPNAIAVYLELARIEAAIRKSPDGAKEVFLKGLERNPDNLQLLIALAGLYEQTGDKTNAKKTYEHILQVQPNTDVAINNLAALLVDSNNDDDVKKGLALAEKFKAAENPYLQDTYAWGLVKTGQTTEALKLLEALILKEPKLADLRYHLGVAHFNNGNKTTAAVELKQAISLADKQQRDFSGKAEAKKLLEEIEHSGKN